MWKTWRENAPIFTLFSHIFTHLSHAFHMHISHACEILHSEIYVERVWSTIIPFTHIFTYTSHGVSHRLSHVNPHWMAKQFHMLLKITHIYVWVSLFQVFRKWSAVWSQRARKTIRTEKGRGSPTPPPSNFFLITTLCAITTIWKPGTGYMYVYCKFVC